MTVHENALTIKGQKKHEIDEKTDGSVRKERFYGSFNRTLSLPSDIDAKNVKAAYQNGVLELFLPKIEEAKPKEIKVEIK